VKQSGLRSVSSLIGAKARGVLFVCSGWLTWVLRLALHAPWVLPTLLALHLFKARLRLRIVVLDSSRIGHFVPGAAAWKAYLRQHPPTPEQRVVFSWPVPAANQQWDRMARRNLRRLPNADMLAAWNRLLPPPGVLDTGDPTGDPLHDDLFLTLDGRLEFADDEVLFAESRLQSLGWKPGEPWVCLLVRDAAYLRSSRVPIHPSIGWAYHDYRNGTVDSYRPATEMLLDEGFWVFRMGKIAGCPLSISNDRFIDYPFWEGRSDLLDIWLFAHCAGCVTTGSGPDTVSRVWRRPILMLNRLPLPEVWLGCDVVSVPKSLRWRDTGRPLSLRDYVRTDLYQSRAYRDAGIAYEEQPPEMIRDLVSEFLPRLAGDPPIPESALQSRFWAIFSAEMLATHGITVKRSEAQIERVGEAWLRAQPPEFWE